MRPPLPIAVFADTSVNLVRQLAANERRIDTHDSEIRSLVAAIRELMDPPRRRTDRIGFHVR